MEKLTSLKNCLMQIYEGGDFRIFSRPHPVPDDIASEWESWRDALKALETLRIPRTYVSCLSQTVTKELHVYADTSEKAIATRIVYTINC
jgi:hypothetical protein